MTGFNSQTQTAVETFLKGSFISNYVDRRLVLGLRSYMSSFSAITIPDYKFSKARLNKVSMVSFQSKYQAIIEAYQKTSGSKEQMQYLGYCILTSIIVFLKIQELKSILNSNESDMYGISDIFLNKLVDGVDLVDDLAANFDSYKVNPSKGDLRYVEMGLKRLLASEIDLIA